MKKLIKISILILFVFPVYSHALTLSQIKTEIRIRIKDTNSSRQRYTDTQLTNLINQTQRDVVNLSWIVKKSTSIQLVAGTTYYNMPPDYLGMHRMMLNSQNLPETTLQELDSRFNFGNWPLSMGLPDHYFQDPSLPGEFGVYPWPNNAQSTGTISAIYYAQVADLALDSDVPFNAVTQYLPYNDVLIYEPCYKIFLIESEFTKASEYKSYYESRMQILQANIGNKTNFLPGFSGQRR